MRLTRLPRYDRAPYPGGIDETGTIPLHNEIAWGSDTSRVDRRQRPSNQPIIEHCAAQGVVGKKVKWSRTETCGSRGRLQGLLRSGSCSKVPLILGEECLIDGVHYKYGRMFLLALGGMISMVLFRPAKLIDFRLFAFPSDPVRKVHVSPLLGKGYLAQESCRPREEDTLL